MGRFLFPPASPRFNLFQARVPADVPRCIDAGTRPSPRQVGHPGAARGPKARAGLRGGEFHQPGGDLVQGGERRAPSRRNRRPHPCRSHPSASQRGFRFFLNQTSLAQPGVVRRGSPARGEAEGFPSPSPRAPHASPISTRHLGEPGCTGARQQTLTPAGVPSPEIQLKPPWRCSGFLEDGPAPPSPALGRAPSVRQTAADKTGGGVNISVIRRRDTRPRCRGRRRPQRSARG